MAAKVVAECLRRRVAIPAPYNDPPRYNPQLFGIFIQAFNRLTQERKPSEKNGKRIVIYRIEHRAIREWAQDNGFARDFDFQEELLAYIKALDVVWVELEVQRLKKVKADG